MTNVIQHPSSPLVAEDRLRTALLEPSKGLLSELLDDAVVLVEADGSVCNKRAVVMEQMKALVRFHTFDVIERGVQVWADTAVVVSRVRRVALVSMGNGALEALADDVRYTRVWRTVGRGLAFVCVAGHARAAAGCGCAAVRFHSGWSCCGERSSGQWPRAGRLTGARCVTGSRYNKGHLAMALGKVDVGAISHNFSATST